MSTPRTPMSPSSWEADALSLYQRLLPASFWEPLQKRPDRRQNNRLYNLLVVMWLLIAQRLHRLASLETAVLELLRGLPPSFWPRPCQRLRDWRAGRKLPSGNFLPPSFWPRPCQRLRDWRAGRKLPSGNTGAYNQARQGLPLHMVEQSCDRIFEQLTARLNGVLPAVGRRAFFIDGTSVRTAHRSALCQAYPPHAQGHWPVLRMLVAHDLETGLAMRPQWGPMYGTQAVSEQKLLEEAMDRLPEGSVLVGDANFGVFS